MKDFIMKLFENEYFPIYLGGVILVLIIAFLVVFFLGRKDKKKIEKTQKLEVVNDNTFKEVSAPVTLETPAVNTNQVTPQIVPQVSNLETTPVQEPVQMPASEVPVMPNVETTEPAPVINSYVEPAPQVVTPPVIEPTPVVPDVNNYQSVPTEVTPVAPIIEPPIISESFVTPEVNTTPAVEQNLANFENLASSIADELEQLEKQQQLVTPSVAPEVAPVIDMPIPPTEAPTVTQTPSQNSTTVMNDVFSSVYAPKREEVVVDDTMAIELPKLKAEPVLTDNQDNNELKL